jgi:hypothetical protein
MRGRWPAVVRRLAAVTAVAVLALDGPAAVAWAAQPTSPTAAAPVEQCVVQDNRLAELSGLAADAAVRYAVADGGRRLQVLVLRRDCTVQRVITAAVDPYDIEDLALDRDGRLWLADIGDNDRRRETVALHVLAQDGSPPLLYRLTYPDGPHDAEALLLDRDGVPYVVTKETLGSSGVYRPATALAVPGPTPLELVTRVRFGRTATPGGPVAGIGSMLVTGGASSADGRVAALRTYTDAYLFDVGDSDLVTALGREPVRVPLPNESQGEAIAFEPDGTLLSGSERADAGPQPIRAVPGATALVPAAELTPTSVAPPAAAGPSGPNRVGQVGWQTVLIAIAAVGALAIAVFRIARH